MAFIRATKSQDRIYYSLVEAYRDSDGGPRQRTLVYLGIAPTLDESLWRTLHELICEQARRGASRRQNVLLTRIKLLLAHGAQNPICPSGLEAFDGPVQKAWRQHRPK